MQRLLYSCDARRITYVGVQCFEIDLRFAEEQTKQLGLPVTQDSLRGVRQVTLLSLSLSPSDPFTSVAHLLLKQLVNLLLADNILEFLDERVRRAKYSEVNDIPKLINLLQKYIPLPFFSLSLSLSLLP